MPCIRLLVIANIKPLQSFIDRFVACSAQISADRQTDPQTHGTVEVCVKKDFVPRVTLGTILNQQNLELL